jgi:hypothetical protein
MKTILKSLLQQWKFAAAVAIFLVLATAVYHVLHRKELPSLPISILHLALTEETKGEAARQMINALHGRNITPEDNLIGTYISPDGSGTLYVSQYESERVAAVACDSTERILADGRSGFTHFRKINSGGEHYAMCLSNEKAHYIFIHNANLYWWSVDASVAQASIRDLLKRVQIP